MKILRLSFLFLLSIMTFSASYSLNPSDPNTHNDVPEYRSPFAGMTIKDFLDLTPKKYRLVTGKKLTLSERVSLKVAQYKIKRLVKKNPHIDTMSIVRDSENNNFDIVGFVLGLALGPLGVLIAYLLEGKSSARFTWAVIGGLIWLGVFLLVVVIL